MSLSKILTWVFVFVSTLAFSQGGYPVQDPSTIPNGKIRVHSDNGTIGVLLDSLIGTGSGITFQEHYIVLRQSTTSDILENWESIIFVTDGVGIWYEIGRLGTTTTYSNSVEQHLINDLDGISIEHHEIKRV